MAGVAKIRRGFNPEVNKILKRKAGLKLISTNDAGVEMFGSLRMTRILLLWLLFCLYCSVLFATQDEWNCINNSWLFDKKIIIFISIFFLRGWTCLSLKQPRPKSCVSFSNMRCQVGICHPEWLQVAWTFYENRLNFCTNANQHLISQSLQIGYSLSLIPKSTLSTAIVS